MTDRVGNIDLPGYVLHLLFGTVLSDIFSLHCHDTLVQGFFELGQIGKGRSVSLFMYKKHEAGLFFKRGEVQIRKQALITLDMLIQAKPKGISFSEVNFGIGGKRGSFDRKYNVVFYTGI